MQRYVFLVYVFFLFNMLLYNDDSIEGYNGCKREEE